MSKLALPGVHSYTCPVNDAHIQDARGDDIEILTWLHPKNGTSVDYSPTAIPILRAKHGTEPSASVLIYSHGNAEDVSMTYAWISYLSRRFEMDVLAYDYTGYGTNYTAASDESIYDNAMSVVAYVKARLTSYEHVILYGRSIGTAPAAYAAVHAQGIDGVILQSAFCSIVTTRLPMFMKKYVPRCVDMLFNADLLKKCDVPVLLIHGKKDKVVPFSHALQLAQLPCVWAHCWIDGAQHNDLEAVELYREEMCTSIHHFIQSIDHTSTMHSPPQGKAETRRP